MPKSLSQKKANADYMKRRLKRIPVDVHKPVYAGIAAAAEKSGLPVNTFVKAAIDEKIDRDGLRDIANEAEKAYKEGGHA